MNNKRIALELLKVAKIINAVEMTRENAERIMDRLQDLIKNGLAKDVHLKKLREVQEFLGISEGGKELKKEDTADEAAFSRAHSAIEAFERLITKAYQDTKNGDKKERLNAKNRLDELRSARDVAMEILSGKTSGKDKEERIKGLLMHSRSVHGF